MKVFTLSYFSNGSVACTDGVYDVCSSISNALKRLSYYLECYNESVIDFDADYATQRIFTDKGTYLIETFTLDIDIDE